MRISLEPGAAAGRGAMARQRICRGATALVLAISASAGWFAARGLADGTADNLYRSLLRTPLENVPPGRSVKIAEVPLGTDAAATGLAGIVSITFPGGDPRAQITYYVFDNTGNAVAYDNQHLSMPPHTGKLLAYPPMAHCADTSNGGYCDLIVEGSSVVITTAASTPMDRASVPMMGLAFQHLTRVLNESAQAPAPPVVGGLSACDLVDPADVEAAIGSATNPPKADQIGGCSWMSQRGSGLSIQPQEGGRSKFEFDRRRTQGAILIPGIGADAFGFQSLAGFVQINLLKGDHYVVIILQGEGPVDRMQAATALAARVSARM
jgi:hypothetical protein